MKEERQQAYLNIIEALLIFFNDEEELKKILTASKNLLDAGFFETLETVAEAFLQDGDMDVAAWLRELGTFISKNHAKSEALKLNEMAFLKVEQGNIQDATQLYQQSLIISKEIGDIYLEANCSNNLGQVYSKLGNFYTASAYYQQSLEISQQMGDTRQQAICLNNLGQVYSELGNFYTASAYYQQSLEISQQMGDTRQQAICIENLGQIYSKLEDYSLAIDCFRQSLALKESLNETFGVVAILSRLGDVYTKSRNIEEAIAVYQKLLTIYTPNSFPEERASICHLLEHIFNLVIYKVVIDSPAVVNTREKIEIIVNLKQAKITEEGYSLQISLNQSIGAELNILLTAPGFQINGDNTASIPLDPSTNQLAQTARFCLTALRPGTNTITAELYRGDIFETKLETSIQVTNVDGANLTTITTQPRPVPQPDFILQVKTVWNLTSSTCSFQYIPRSFRFPSMFTANNVYNSESLSSAWLEQVRELLANTLENISDSLPSEGKSCLISLGQYLFRRLFPTELQADFRTLIPRNSTFTLLILASEGASIPWELLHDGQSFLGERFIIGRWFWELNDTRPYEFPVGAVNVAHYANVEQPELWANLLEAPGAPVPKHLLEGVLNNLDSTEAMRGLHLIRYAQADIASNAPVRVDGADYTQDIEQQVRPVKLNLRRNRPFVSLSYVKTDINESTNLEETWAATFIRAGCSSFVGALWAVSPNVEAAFVSCFYNRLWAGEFLGKAFYSSRQLARAVAPDSLDWLAYVLFGDPMARPYRPVEGKGYAVVEPIGREVDEPVMSGVPIRFRLSLRRTPPVWHEERVIEVAEDLSFENLQVHVKTFGLQVNPDSIITMSLAPAGNYIGWFTLVASAEMANSSAVVQVYFMDGIMPIHSIMFSLNIANAGGDAV